MNQSYIETARMLVRVAPVVIDNTLALKGGTAINLFMRDMPRLSVDLDLTFLDHTLSRSEALASIDATLQRAAANLKRAGYMVHLPGGIDDIEQKLFVERDRVRIRVEVNHIIRGTVEAPRVATLVPKAQRVLGLTADVPLLSNEDVYGGKLVAALDRQHPRDLFDVAELFADQGLTPGICRAFVVYLASHNRPMHEVLFPTELDIEQVYESSFVGMTAQPIALNDLLAARARLIRDLPAALTADQRDFLISLASGKPAWELLDVPHAEQMPAIRWRLHNLQLLAQNSPAKLEAQRNELAARFEKVPIG